MSKRRSSWSGPKTDAWDFGPAIDEENLFLDPEIDCELDFELQRHGGNIRKGIFAGLLTRKEDKVPLVIECDGNNDPLSSKNGTIDFDISPRRCGGVLPARGCEVFSAEQDLSVSSNHSISRKSSHGRVGIASDAFESDHSPKSKTEDRGLMIPSEIRAPPQPSNKPSNHRRVNAAFEFLTGGNPKIGESKTERERRSFDDDLGYSRLKAASGTRTSRYVTSKVEVDLLDKERFSPQNNPEPALVDAANDAAVHSTSANNTKIWEMDPEDNDSSASDYLNLPTECPVPRQPTSISISRDDRRQRDQTRTSQYQTGNRDVTEGEGNYLESHSTSKGCRTDRYGPSRHQDRTIRGNEGKNRRTSYHGQELSSLMQRSDSERRLMHQIHGDRSLERYDSQTSGLSGSGRLPGDATLVKERTNSNSSGMIMDGHGQHDKITSLSASQHPRSNAGTGGASSSAFRENHSTRAGMRESDTTLVKERSNSNSSGVIMDGHEQHDKITSLSASQHPRSNAGTGGASSSAFRENHSSRAGMRESDYHEEPMLQSLESKSRKSSKVTSTTSPVRSTGRQRSGGGEERRIRSISSVANGPGASERHQRDRRSRGDGGQRRVGNNGSVTSETERRRVDRRSGSDVNKERRIRSNGSVASVTGANDRRREDRSEHRYQTNGPGITNTSEQIWSSLQQPRNGARNGKNMDVELSRSSYHRSSTRSSNNSAKTSISAEPSLLDSRSYHHPTRSQKLINDAMLDSRSYHQPSRRAYYDTNREMDDRSRGRRRESGDETIRSRAGSLPRNIESRQKEAIDAELQLATDSNKMVYSSVTGGSINNKTREYEGNTEPNNMRRAPKACIVGERPCENEKCYESDRRRRTSSLPRRPSSRRLEATISFDNAKRHPFTVSNENGRIQGDNRYSRQDDHDDDDNCLNKEQQLEEHKWRGSSVHRNGAVDNYLLHQSSTNQQQQQGRRKSYMDAIFGLGSHSVHGVSTMKKPYKSAPAG